MKNKVVERAVFIIGWLLSPATFWNDAFINIPVAYLAANVAIRFFSLDFTLAMIIAYWCSNILGIVMMAVAGKRIFSDKNTVIREVSILLMTMLAYTALLFILSYISVLKPIGPAK